MPVAPFDDSTIQDEDGLIRFVSPHQVVEDANLGRRRPSSAAFSMSSTDGCMSVDLEEELKKDGCDSCHNLSLRGENFGAARLQAKNFRNESLSPFRDPIDDNEYHGNVANLKEHGKISKGVRNRLSRIADFLRIPTP